MFRIFFVDMYIAYVCIGYKIYACVFVGQDFLSSFFSSNLLKSMKKILN